MNLKEGLTVLSLFDGISCGMIALDRVGIKVKAYYASEIDKPAMKVAKHNWANIIHIGDVTKVRYAEGWLYSENGDFYVGRIDLLIGGSPCQDFSIANSEGKGFEGEKSSLIFEYFRLFNEIKPEYFLLENVAMKPLYKNYITNYLKIKCKEINSSLISAQSRPRLYWSNIPYNQDIIDRNIYLIDILESKIEDKYYHSEAALNYMDRVVKGGRNHWDFAHHSDTLKSKSSCITANFKKGVPYNVLIDRRPEVRQLNPFHGCSTKQPKMQHRIYDTQGKAVALTSFAGRLTVYPDKEDLIRRLTPVECERLQTIPDNYTCCVSDSHRYAVIGNGWTVDVICHLFEPLLHEI